MIVTVLGTLMIIVHGVQLAAAQQKEQKPCRATVPVRKSGGHKIKTS